MESNASEYGERENCTNSNAHKAERLKLKVSDRENSVELHEYTQ